MKKFAGHFHVPTVKPAKADLKLLLDAGSFQSLDKLKTAALFTARYSIGDKVEFLANHPVCKSVDEATAAVAKFKKKYPRIAKYWVQGDQHVSTSQLANSEGSAHP